MDDLYKCLGVTRKATNKEIRSAYRRVARRVHPDVSQSPNSAEQFAKVTEAYRILGDPERRARYDRGEPVSPRRVSFYASDRDQVFAYNFDRVIKEELEHERQETRVREQVVSVVVALFVSTFIVALAKPVFFHFMNWRVSIPVGVLSLMGMWYLWRAIRFALDHYTYQPEPPSVTNPPEPHEQPFTRRTALAFLAGGYVISMAAGAFVDMLSGGFIGGGFFAGHAVLGVFMYPPIAVMIVDAIRRIGAAMDVR
jgi:hypothetical protein